MVLRLHESWRYSEEVRVYSQVETGFVNVLLCTCCSLSLHSAASSNEDDTEGVSVMSRVAINMLKYNSYSVHFEATQFAPGAASQFELIISDS